MAMAAAAAGVWLLLNKRRGVSSTKARGRRRLVSSVRLSPASGSKSSAASVLCVKERCERQRRGECAGVCVGANDRETSCGRDNDHSQASSSWVLIESFAKN